jgi:transcriptional regulator with XRE-family HTH domain
MNIEIADRLVELRRIHHFSQEELAAKLGVSRQAVSKWERAESSPDTDNLIALARLYGVSLDALLLTDGIAFHAQSEPQAGPDPSSGYDDGPSLYEQQLGWEAEERGRRKNALYRFPFPVAVTVFYLATGFLFNWWHPGWMLFFTIPIYYWLVSVQ